MALIEINGGLDNDTAARLPQQQQPGLVYDDAAPSLAPHWQRVQDASAWQALPRAEPASPGGLQPQVGLDGSGRRDQVLGPQGPAMIHPGLQQGR
jgi:hypothetical protein